MEKCLANDLLADQLVAVDVDPETMDGADHCLIDAPPDGVAGASNGPESDTTDEDGRQGDQRPFTDGQGQTSSGITPVFPYWYAMAFRRAMRTGIGGCVASRLATNPCLCVRRRPRGSAMQR